jgi:glycosyltransferase involved in cell wall biosynthesis
MNIVIIGHNEGDTIERMSKELDKFFLKDKKIWVLDRCDDNSEELCHKLSLNYIKTPNTWKGRMVSSARNLGLSVCDKDSDVLFLDGDRYPVSGHKDFHLYNSDILLFLVENDERDDPKWFTDYSQIYGHLHNGFYSCGLFMKRSAINKVLEFQGELFSTDIERFWGVEDVHLGDVCFHLGLTCKIHKKMRLRGSFDKDKRIPLDAWRARVAKRLPLNIIW